MEEMTKRGGKREKLLEKENIWSAEDHKARKGKELTINRRKKINKTEKNLRMRIPYCPRWRKERKRGKRKRKELGIGIKTVQQLKSP